MANPLDQPQDYVLLGGRKTPGLCEIYGADAPRNWEEQSGAGYSGGILLFRGIKLSHFTIRVYLYTSEDWDAWYKFRTILKKPTRFGAFPKAIDCVHPFLADLGITACVIDNERAPSQVDHGVWSIEIECIEYRKLKASAGKVDGSDATETDPREAKIKKLKAEHDKLADEDNRIP